MTCTNFCKKMDVTTKKLVWNWAKKLDADEIIIHRNGTVTLTCKDGIICENYRPTAKELY